MFNPFKKGDKMKQRARYRKGEGKATDGRKGRDSGGSMGINMGEHDEADKSASLEDQYTQDAKLELLEQENAKLKATMRVFELEKKGLDSENLQRRAILTTEKLEKLKDEEVDVKKELTDKSEIVEGDENIGLSNHYGKIKDKTEPGRRLIRNQISQFLGSTVDLTAADLDYLAKRKLELERKLKAVYPTNKETAESNKGVDSSRVIRKTANFSLKYGKEAGELQNINKILDPGNQSAGKLDYLGK